jgi:succinate dehydrogenase / fumarate reductase membrane anchor subunit
MDMVTAVTTMGRSGLYDWLFQRISAVTLLAYFILVSFVLLKGVDYASWTALYAQTWMRVFSLMALLSLGVHAWIGLWSVFSDYFTERLMGQVGNVLRFLLQVISGVVMFTYVVWGIQILWGL